MEQISKYIASLPGFKLSKSHFRIGSKIHISTFYYAKRFFQNSFFASRLAFIIARHILSDNLKFLRDDAKRITFEKEGLTLVGYGLYSELLMSLLEKFLKKALGIENINHNLINDAEELDWIKKHEKQYKNYLIIVPIASTFSTSFKIEELINGLPGEKFIFPPPINVLLISDNIIDSETPSEIEAKFGWKRKKPLDRLVYVGSLDAKEQTVIYKEHEHKEQKYFLTLPSTWYEVQRCKICFPDNPIEEKPIFVTDKTSVTPLLIFDKPRGRKIPKNGKNPFKLNKNALKYGHFEREGNHYLYYVKIEQFFNDNRLNIESWLHKVVADRRFKTIYNETDDVIIIAPGHYSNASFVNLVNEVLFSNAANIIHYDPKNDHIQNFQTFYQNEIGGKSKKIFYVDDTITTGSTFIRSNYFLKHTRATNEGFDGCIVMIDRSSSYVHENILRKLQYREHYFSFSNLNLGSLKDVENDCSLCNEQERYRQLADSSFLDRLKVHFLNQAIKLNLGTNLESNENGKPIIGDQHIQKVEVVHRLYQWFNKFTLEQFKEMSFETWKASWFKNTYSPYENAQFISNKSDQFELSEETGVLFKVLTQSPFTHYKPLKQKIFIWVLFFLNKKKEQISADLDLAKPIFPYQHFKDLKFLIRRAGLLGSNYLISLDFLDTIKLILLDTSQKIIREDIETVAKKQQNDIQQGFLFPISNSDSEKKMKNLKSFNVFYSAQVKELLFMNEARSIRLEMNLMKMEEGIQGQQPTPFSQLLRILREENGILIAKFWDFIKTENLWNVPDSTIQKQLESVYGVLKNPTIENHYRYETLKEFFAVTGTPIEGNKDFIHYLCLMNHLSKEKSIGTSLADKTRYIIDRLKSIIGCDSEDIGASFIVKYDKNKDDVFFAHSESSHHTISDTNWCPTEQPYLKKFLNGIADSTSDSNLTIIEFQRTGENQWKDLYAIKKNDTIGELPFSTLPEKFNKVIILRINKRSGSTDAGTKTLDEVQGIIVLYFNCKNKHLATPVDKTRYLLLLRNKISDFISEHHENSDFRDWVENDKQRRLANLTGHGRETLLDLVHDYPVSKNIILNMEHLQTIILLKNNMKSIRGDDSSEIFRKFYSVQNIMETDVAYFSSVEKMVLALFEKHEHIENISKVNQVMDIQENLKFQFSTSILDMIFFELIVNAKKNRWHFLQDDQIEGYLNDEKIIFDRNYVWISSEINSEGKLEISISNTGPQIEKTALRELQTKVNIKGWETLSGISLIESLLKEFNLGEIDYSSTPINTDYGFSKFTVTMKLNKM